MDALITRLYPFEICFDSIRENLTGRIITEPTLLINETTGRPLKMGEYIDVLKEFKQVQNLEDDYKIICFNTKHPEHDSLSDKHNFTQTEICTIFNWLCTCSVSLDIWRAFKALSISDMKEQIKYIRNMLY